MQVYEKVREYIDDYGIRQNVLAKKCNISASTFNAIMNGKRKMYAEDLRAICFALNVSPELFIEFNKNRENHTKGHQNIKWTK